MNVCLECAIDEVALGPVPPLIAAGVIAMLALAYAEQRRAEAARQACVRCGRDAVLCAQETEDSE